MNTSNQKLDLFLDKPIPNKFAFVDIETTGMRLDDRITEIGILLYENGECIRKFTTLINPQKQIDYFIKNITGITNSMVKDAPLFHEVAKEIYQILDGAIFVAHNVYFDYNFLKKEFGWLGKEMHMDHMCSVKLSQKFFPNENSHNLDAVMQRMNIYCEKRHRAFDDARVISEFFHKLSNSLEKSQFEEALKQLIRRVK